MIDIYPFQTQEVRDLAWACFSPPLLHTEQLVDAPQRITDCGLALTCERQVWLEQLDHNASALLEHLSLSPTHRLGVYFEHLWHFFLEHDPATELVAHNLPIHYQGMTIGEFDCIYFCHQRQRHFHLELAVKYFLSARQSTRNEPASRWREWLGPNAQDRLDLKLNHIMQRQIQLGDNPVAREQLQRLGIPELAKEVAIKGYLFQSAADPLPPPRGFNRDCSLSQWIDIQQLHTYLSSLNASSYLILPKMKWLSPAIGETGATHMTNDQLQGALTTHFSRDHYPILIAALDAFGREHQRFFVADAGWPATMQKTPSTTG